MSKILIAPNSFKECADSVTLSELIDKNLKSMPNVELIKKPISDGGDGFISVCKYHFGGEFKEYKISTPFSSSLMECPILYVEESKTIFIESAEIVGLKVVPQKFRDPMNLSSKGLGELLLKIRDDVEQGCIYVDRIFIGAGGTATIDMGLGMMGVLGLRLLGSGSTELAVLPRNFNKVRTIKWNKISLPFDVLPVADVVNKLTGKTGGVMVYGSQKGANQDELVKIDSGFSNILNILKNSGLIKSPEFLSGAGGGIPAAFQIFFDSYCKSAYEFILHHLELDDRLNKFDYLITGEGAFDKQTLFGKGAGLLVMYFANKVKNVFLICGKADDEIRAILPNNAIIFELLHFFKDTDTSIKKYQSGIQKVCEEISEKILY